MTQIESLPLQNNQVAIFDNPGPLASLNFLSTQLFLRPHQ